MITVMNTTPGELTIEAPQSEINKMIQNCECSGVKVQRPYKKPAPMPPMVMNFENPLERSKQVSQPAEQQGTTRRRDGKPTPIPTMVHNYADPLARKK